MAIQMIALLKRVLVSAPAYSRRNGMAWNPVARTDGAADEPPRRMFGLLAVLAVLAHGWAASLWHAPERRPVVIPPSPQAVEVALLAPMAPNPPPQPMPAAPPVAQPPQAPPKPKPLPKRQVPPKPAAKAIPPRPRIPRPAPEPAEREATDSGPTEPPRPAMSTPAETAPVHEPAPSAPAPVPRKPEPVVPASFHAAYLHNPSPVYPAAARSRRWEGTVRLRVRVSAEGHCEHAEIQESSGYELLDEAALEVIRQWRFVPAKRGDTVLPSSVVVPITFKLNH